MPRTKSGKPSVGKPERHFKKWRVRIRFYDDRGRRKTRLRSYDTQAEAETYWRQFRSYRKVRDTTIGQLVDDYKAVLDRKGNRAESVKQTEYRLRRILDLDRPLDLLTTDYAQRTYLKLAETEGVAVDTQHDG
jgi:N-glycosylase/DNA lyase